MLAYRSWTKLPTHLKRLSAQLISIQSVHAWPSEELEEVDKGFEPTKKEALLDFTKFEEAYAGHASSEILKSLAILRLCKSPGLVQNADKLVDASRIVLGDWITYSAIEHSLFKQFCPGSGREQALGRMQFLARHGIGCIFDWAPTQTPSLYTSPESFPSNVDVNMKRLIDGIDCAALDEKTRMTAVKLATITCLQTLSNISRTIRHVLANDPESRHRSMVVSFNRYLAGMDNATHQETLDAKDKQELENLKTRLEALASIAASKGVRLLIDAEESEIQPAIDYVALSVMEKVNKSEARVWNTYQCYLKETPTKLRLDIDHLFSKGCAAGVKLVRGAYLQHETELATKMHLPTPVFEGQAQTDVSYNQCAKLLLNEIQSSRRVELCLATHNQRSIELALDHMRSVDMDQKEAPVYFAQIYGMRDYLTFALGHHQFKALKLLVFGDVHHIVPFLVRRAQENSSVLGGSQSDVDALKAAFRNHKNNFMP